MTYNIGIIEILASVFVEGRVHEGITTFHEVLFWNKAMAFGTHPTDFLLKPRSAYRNPSTLTIITSVTDTKLSSEAILTSIKSDVCRILFMQRLTTQKCSHYKRTFRRT